MNLNVKNWIEFELGELFDTVTGYYNNKPETSQFGIPFLGGTDSNNGRTCFVSYDSVYTTNKIGKEDSSINGKIFSGNCITVTTDGSVCCAYYQPEQFTGSHSFIALYPKSFALNRDIALFICTIINNERYRFSYGRKIHSESKMKKMQIKLPVDANKMPDFKFMESCIKNLKNKQITTKNFKSNRKIDTNTWKEFRLGDYFDIKKGKRLTSDEQSEGLTPYIGAIDSNNGVANYIGQSAIHSGNTISLSYNGSVGEAFYQPKSFWATDDVNVLYFKEKNNYKFNKYVALFICTVLKNEKYRYSYGRKWVLENMKDTVIKLPTISDMPDWKFMEQYIKSLPFGDRI